MKRVVAVVTGREQLEFVEEEIPALGPHDLLIRIDAVGLCHTDLPRFLCQQTYGISPRGYREVQKVVPPCTLGHEPVGTIIDVGSAVTRFAIGDRVTGNVQDVFATHKVVPDDAILLKLPELPFDYRRCIVEPVGCVVNIINHALEDGAKTVGVVGCGVMGLMTIAGLRARGVQQVVALDVFDEKLETAKKYGATHTVNSIRKNAVDAVHTLTDGGFLDAIVEITGSLKGLQTACSIIKFPRKNGLLTNPFTGRGKIVIASVYAKEEPFPLSLANELVLRGPILDAAHPCAGEDLMKNNQAAIDAMVSGQIPLQDMITHTIPFNRLAEGFAWLESAPKGYLKGIVYFE